MELQLGLSLSIHNPIIGSNLNKNGFESKDLLGLSPWSRTLDKKRSYEDAFMNNKLKVSSQTQPLLLWSGQPDDGGDDEPRKKKTPSCPLNKNDEVAMEGEDHVVGWPPIKSWRKKVLHHQQQGFHIVKKRVAAARNLGNNYSYDYYNYNNNKNNGGSNPMYVKVKMEGVAIARKINLRDFQTYQTLVDSLISMFTKCHEVEEDSRDYTLTYQDKHGDWLHAGDVPWQTFMESVQRLELLRSGG